MSPKYDKILEGVLQLPRAERLALADAIHASIASERAEHPHDEAPFTDEELAELMTPNPMTPREIVARGLLGGWGDQGIDDGAEWVNQRKRERQARQ